MRGGQSDELGFKSNFTTTGVADTVSVFTATKQVDSLMHKEVFSAFPVFFSSSDAAVSASSPAENLVF